MTVNSEQLAYAGKSAIDYFLENDPIDNINIAHPFIEKLLEGKVEYSGGLQYVTEQLRISNDSNFQSYQGAGAVTYNNRRTLNQAKYTYGSFHDGFGLDEDELVRNGITMTDERSATPSADEKVNITNLMKENTAVLKLGMTEGLDKMLHRDGTQDSEAIPGLDALISITPSTGTVGTIAASNSYWQNFVDLTLGTTATEFIDALEAGWRACILYGGSPPDYMPCGSDFIDAYRNVANDTVNRQIFLGNGSSGNKQGATIDAGTGSGTRTGLFFKGVELIWDPVFEALDAEDAPTVTWSSRLYMINTRHLKLRPIKGHWMVSRRPPRVYDRYVNYWALTAKLALTTGKRNAHAVFALG